MHNKQQACHACMLVLNSSEVNTQVSASPAYTRRAIAHTALLLERLLQHELQAGCIAEGVHVDGVEGALIRVHALFIIRDRKGHRQVSMAILSAQYTQCIDPHLHFIIHGTPMQGQK